MRIRGKTILAGTLFLAAALAIHGLFLLLFRPRELKMVRRSPTSRFSVMVRMDPGEKGQEDPLDLRYWLELDRGAIYSKPDRKTGYSSLVFSRTCRPPENLSVRTSEKKEISDCSFPSRTPAVLDPSVHLPLAFLSVPEKEHILSGGGRFRDCAGKVLPGLGTQKILFSDQGTGYVFFTVEKDPSNRFPPRIRRILSSGSAALDRLAEKILAGQAVSPSSGIPSGRTLLCFESAALNHLPEQNP